MPIYEYQCDACNHKFEILQKMSDNLLTVCPDCNEDKLRKLVSAAAFHLKGTGWYETDFKDKKPEQKTDSSGEKSDSNNKGDGEKSKPAESKETKKTEPASKSKTETKKPTKTSPSE